VDAQLQTIESPVSYEKTESSALAEVSDPSEVQEEEEDWEEDDDE
jgi:hypothetical protein